MAFSVVVAILENRSRCLARRLAGLERIPTDT